MPRNHDGLWAEASSVNEAWDKGCITNKEGEAWTDALVLDYMGITPRAASKSRSRTLAALGKNVLANAKQIRDNREKSDDGAFD
ncbi:MAG: hypothetical protein ACYTFN_14770 [Planctomycetota bacterium]|jgi:hypothetical protein